MPVPEYFRAAFCSPQVLKLWVYTEKKKTLRADTVYGDNSIDLFQ